MTMITKAVIEQTTIVSMNGSSKATIPSSAGWETLAAECAIAAEPMPASLEKTARLTPMIKIPKKPPNPASKLKALVKINLIAPGIASM